MDATGMVLLGMVTAVVLWAVAIYNRLIRQRNEIGNAFAQIDVQLKRRHDLIPNLVEIARKYLQHERETLEAVIAARNTAKAAAGEVRAQPLDAARVGALTAAEGVLGGALSRLMALVESYPELKADQSLRELNEELTHTENRVAFARQAFNDAVLDFNNAAQQFPARLVARLFGFGSAAPLEATQSAAERAAPRVSF
jgi:LemA protein